MSCSFPIAIWAVSVNLASTGVIYAYETGLIQPEAAAYPS
jgi:hypothetical protein